MTTLYERIGGEAAVDKAVDIFYDKIMADDRIKSFFENIDMFAQARKQKLFLTMVFGGPSEYTGKDMRSGHDVLNIFLRHGSCAANTLNSGLCLSVN